MQSASNLVIELSLFQTRYDFKIKLVSILQLREIYLYIVVGLRHLLSLS